MDQVELVIPRSLLRSNFALLLDTYPIRSLAVTVLLYVIAAQVDRQWLWVTMLVVGPALLVSEVLTTQDYVTSTRVVRRRGIFGRSRHEIPLSEVTSVRVRESGFMELAGQRDIEIHGKDDVVEFLGVTNATAVAERIETLAERARTNGRETKSV